MWTFSSVRGQLTNEVRDGKRWCILSPPGSCWCWHEPPCICCWNKTSPVVCPSGVFRRGHLQRTQCKERRLAAALGLHGERPLPEWERRTVRCPLARGAAVWTRWRCSILLQAVPSGTRIPGALCAPGSPAIPVSGAQVQRSCGNRVMVTVHSHDPRHEPRPGRQQDDSNGRK